MSDFLSQFDKTNYEKKDVKENKKVEEKKVNNNVEYEDNEEGIDIVEHDTEVDLKYHKRKIIRYIIIASTIVLMCIIIFIAVLLLNRVTVKNFVGQNVSEAKTWGLKNNIEIDIESIFSIEQDENFIVSQDKEPDKKIQKGSVLFLKVSKGADQEEMLELPDFSTMLQADAKDWLNKYKAYNIIVTAEYSETIEKNKFIKMEFKDSNINETNYKRKDSLTVYFSKGSEKDEKNISVPDFKGKPKTDVETWAKTNSITVTYKDDGSETIELGMVISQNIEPNTKIARSDTLLVTVSVGKGVTVPDYGNFSKEEAAAKEPGLQASIRTIYSDTIPYGKLVSQSEKVGSKLYGENKKIEVVYSEGRPYIDNLVGRYEKDLAPYFYNYTSKGANITYTIDHVDSDKEKGSIVWTSKVQEYIDMNTNIHVYISKGNMAPLVDSSINNNDSIGNNIIDNNTLTP